ncbi:MAG: sigma-70 family RNA polymerase sigma factor [Myxococcales bacterium]|nr:sigma-70 family RNA polymerase sigma factor [Myxococcales bacterium]
MAHTDDITDAVRRAREGDASAWTWLHREYRGTLHAVAISHGPRQGADDVVQETFARAMERLSELRRDDAFGPWLCAIARHLATDGYRRRSRLAALRDVFFARPRPTAEAAEALDALRQLPETYRELLAMKLVEQMTGPEIATRLGRSPAGVRVSLHRGMKLLRERLGEDA